jgi:hypothetical protein
MRTQTRPEPASDRRGGDALRRVVAGVLLTAAALRPQAAASADPDRPGEYVVKAAYLYNFVRFVEWPAEALPEPSAPFVVAVLGDDPFHEVLEGAFAGKTLAGHSAAILRVHDPAEALGAQILFISSSEASSLPRIARTLSNHSILTVGDVPEMARNGAIIAFRIEGNKVRFDINLERSERAGLKLSSQLLKVATIVGEER